MREPSYPRCDLCGRPAVFRDSVPDPTRGGNGIFCYREQLLCAVHGWERRRENTARVEPLNETDNGGV